MMGQNERPVLLQEFFKVLGVEHANAEFFQFGRRPTGQALFRPVRQRTETLFNLPAEHRQFAFLHTALEFASQDLVVQDVIKNWHLTRLLFHRFFQVPQPSEDQQLPQSGFTVWGRQTGDPLHDFPDRVSMVPQSGQNRNYVIPNCSSFPAGVRHPRSERR